MNLSGRLGYGYSGNYGNFIKSTHGTGLNGSLDLKGFYFNPNFLSFDVRPYFDRTQANAEAQSVNRSSGVQATVDLFSGSRFPGTVSYGVDSSSNEQFQFAGVPSLTGSSLGRTLSVSWAALLPEYPQLRANYVTSTSSSSVDGFDQTGGSSSKMLTLNADYNLAGFALLGSYIRTSNDFDVANPLFGEVLVGGGTSSNSRIIATHPLGFGGGFSASASHSTYTSRSGETSSGNSFTSGVGISPWNRMSLNTNVTYTTNVYTTFSQTVADGVVLHQRTPRDSDGVFTNSSASVRLLRGLSLNAHYNYRTYRLADDSFADSQYGGTINYTTTQQLLGMLYFGVGVLDTVDKTGNTGLSLVANVGMGRKLFGWETSADVAYAQNVFTIGSIATTSSYNYGVSTRKKISADLALSGSFRGSQSGLVIQQGNGNNSQNFSGGAVWRKYTFNGNYSQSSGTAVINSVGELTATPAGSLLTSDFLLFDARGFSVSAGTTLFRRVGVSSGFSRFTSASESGTYKNWGLGYRYSARLKYQVRKFYFEGTFNRSQQDVSSIPGGPRTMNSFYLSISRWFNVF